MASVYKRKQDEGLKHPPWYVGYRDENGKQRTKRGFSDKRQTEQLAAKLEHEVMLRKRGLIDPEQVRVQRELRRPIEEHLVAFEKHLVQATPKHVKLVLSRIRKIFHSGNVTMLADLDAETVEFVLGEMLEVDAVGRKTFNHYLSAINQFCNWAEKNRRLSRNPIASLQRLNAATDVRRKRRALSPDEFSRLLESARTSEVKIQCFDGETRARIYTISYLTGLRRAEIGSLTPTSFDLEGNPPTVTLAAGDSKHRKEDVLPLHPDLVRVLPGWLEGIPADHPLFPRLAKRRTWLMVKKDLERAGIPYETEEGIADFHAVGRHTYITELLRNGASLVEARELARHSDINMTMRYTHIGLDDQARAVAAIPAPRIPRPPLPDQNPWECAGSVSGAKACHLPSSADNRVTMELATPQDENPCVNRGSGVICPPLALDGTRDEKWRRRESNPRPEIFPRQLLRV